MLRDEPIGGVDSRRVLCVDLDGTLVATDLLWESLLSAVRLRPWIVLLLPFWVLRGRPYLKRRLAEAAEIDFGVLPYRPDVVSFVTAQHLQGRSIVLATAADHLLASGVSRHLGCFTEILASDGTKNLKGRAKAGFLVARFGRGNFDYLGDSRADVHCWANAAEAFTVGASPQRVAHLRRLGGARTALSTRVRLVLRALRPHQWAKNALLMVPALAAHRIDWDTLSLLAPALVSFSLLASGGYVLNDLLDLGADRLHPRKRRRPFAAGELSLRAGAMLVAVTWGAGFGLALVVLPSAFATVSLMYLTCTFAYSVRLKREAVLDVMFLAGLYVLRIVAGGLATNVPVSTWLLAFTLFVCLSLAFLKRFIEVRGHTTQPTTIPGRGYLPEDAQLLLSAGLSSAYLSIVVLAIYVNHADITRLYRQPERLLLLCPLLLYWATRIWLGAHRRRLHDDPVVAVIGDPATYAIGALCVAILLSAI